MEFNSLLKIRYSVSQHPLRSSGDSVPLSMRLTACTSAFREGLHVKLVVFFVIAVAVVAAQVQAPSVPAVHSAGGTHAKPSDNQTRGLKLLRVAEADAGGLEGGMRAWALLQVARGYQRTDKAKAMKLIESALVITRSLDNGSNSSNSNVLGLASIYGRPVETKSRLQEQILQTMVPLAPERANRLLDQIDAAGRESVLTALLGYYERNNRNDRALEVIYRINAEQEMPYAAASRMMEHMKPQQSGDFLQLFMASLASYRNHSPHGFSFDGNASDDFSAMVRQHWEHLPKNAVIESIDEILKQADPSDQNDSSKVNNFGVLSGKGSASFRSVYEYRLFELLPVLREVDESGAEEYLKKYREVADAMQKYPNGPGSLGSAPTGSSGNGTDNSASGLPSALSGGVGSAMMKGADFARAQQLVDTAEAGHPDDAMANAGSINDPAVRAWCYGGIADVALLKKPGVAKDATEKMLDASANLEPQERVRYYRAAAETYIKLGELDSAQVTVEKGLAAAKTLYKHDADPDDPNKAMKAFWPATNAYCDLLRIAGKISPGWALTLLKDLPDPEVRVAAESSLAEQLMGVAAGPNDALTINNAGATMSNQ
jgi:hypothetical protein